MKIIKNDHFQFSHGEILPGRHKNFISVLHVNYCQKQEKQTGKALSCEKFFLVSVQIDVNIINFVTYHSSPSV